jgi:hypothetical protein
VAVRGVGGSVCFLVGFDLRGSWREGSTIAWRLVSPYPPLSCPWLCKRHALTRLSPVNVEPPAGCVGRVRLMEALMDSLGNLTASGLAPGEQAVRYNGGAIGERQQ